MKNRYYKDFTFEQIHKGFSQMNSELSHLSFEHKIRKIYNNAVASFRNNEFSYDGSTFVKGRFGDTSFEVASFIHDYRNSFGYVGKSIDNELFSIMIVLHYPPKIIFERREWIRWTWVNVLRHKILGSYKKELPTNLFQL